MSCKRARTSQQVDIHRSKLYNHENYGKAAIRECNQYPDEIIRPNKKKGCQLELITYQQNVKLGLRQVIMIKQRFQIRSGEQENRLSL